MLGFLKKMLGGDNSEKPVVSDPPTEYSGFSIAPCPKQEAGGWSTEAMITKEVERELKTHLFIRADKTGSQEGAVELTLNKCRMTIDQVGDRIFH